VEVGRVTAIQLANYQAHVIMSIRNGIKLTEDPQRRRRRKTNRRWRNTKISKYESGNFLTPTVLDGLPSASQLANTEIFGPVLSLVHANSIEEAMEFLRRSPYGNQASLFTTSGSARANSATKRPQEISASISAFAAPMAYFPFSGWKESFFGILHGQGRDAVEFFTESKIVIERWSRQETRKF